MLTYLSNLPTYIPKPIRVGWYHAGSFVLLSLSMLGLWLTRGECLVQSYAGLVDGFQLPKGHTTFYQIGSYIGFVIGSMIANPFRVLFWLLFVHSMGNVMHWVAFRWPTYFATLRKSEPWQLLVIQVVGLYFMLPEALQKWVGKNAVNGTLAYLLIAWCVGYTIWKYLRDARRARRQLTETATQAELTALKAQINPHFLFNSLNNIFGTALTEGGQRTPEGVQQLSGLLRYQLEKTQVPDVPVEAELRFVDDYVQFHKQLLPNAQAVEHGADWDERPANIAPLLLTPLFDYALQHQTESSNVPVNSQLTVKDRFLNYQLTYPVTLDAVDASPVENLRQRLEKLYPETYTLREKITGATATMQLTIAL